MPAVAAAVHAPQHQAAPCASKPQAAEAPATIVVKVTLALKGAGTPLCCQADVLVSADGSRPHTSVPLAGGGTPCAAAAAARASTAAGRGADGVQAACASQLLSC